VLGLSLEVGYLLLVSLERFFGIEIFPTFEISFYMEPGQEILYVPFVAAEDGFVIDVLGVCF
jgi:hypothetical protein